jgi:hypothetical protein
MYRILKTAKDAYITNKYIAGTRSENSNTGMAGTIDLYKLYNETILPGTSTTPVVEISRGLIKFDYSELAELTASFLDINDPDFQCHMVLRDVYGGQTTPVNFTITAIPLSQSWTEGKGQDVLVYRDLGATNFITASIQNGLAIPWFAPGASLSGNLGAAGIDIIVSGNLGAGLVDMKVAQVFERGDEDLVLDITQHVSACLAGQMENHGFRLSLSDAEEQNNTTYFVKRFGTSHVQNKKLLPRLVVKSNAAIQDYSQTLKFNTPFPQPVYTYNTINGSNYFSGSNEITGNDCLLLKLEASHSIIYTTSSFSISHNANITHTVKGLDTFSYTVTGSQATISGIPQAGIYTADVLLSTVNTPGLADFLSGSQEHQFKMTWISLDGTYTYATEYVTISNLQGTDNAANDSAYVVNIINLKNLYSTKQKVRLRVFVQDYANEMKAYRLPKKLRSKILPETYWRLIGAYNKNIYIPFDDVGTRCSFDADGMYFDMWFQDLDPNEVYEFELLLRENGKDQVVRNEGFRFKVSG